MFITMNQFCYNVLNVRDKVLSFYLSIIWSLVCVRGLCNRKELWLPLVLTDTLFISILIVFHLTFERWGRSCIEMAARLYTMYSLLCVI